MTTDKFVEELEELGACCDGLQWFKERAGKRPLKVVLAEIIRTARAQSKRTRCENPCCLLCVPGMPHLAYTSWFLAKAMPGQSTRSALRRATAAGLIKFLENERG